MLGGAECARGAVGADEKKCVHCAAFEIDPGSFAKETDSRRGPRVGRANPWAVVAEGPLASNIRWNGDGIGGHA